ncbi:hypothetical protein V6x_54440 [Gimesia chilikensis]|uniref:DUF1570 domain-containing protein n=1 Tax=Gimesia chilikensis TaxID=2605989 RepID=A0A517WKD0_9PLAN|nr:hypothetical protein [Gimesia chilikensis]QDU05703.1 hypothetical protein V6x_54440 [Gimesia chilikensis]
MKIQEMSMSKTCILGFMILISLSGGEGQAQSVKDQHWKRIVDGESVAVALTGRKQEQAYRDLCYVLTSYMKSYLAASPNSAAYVRELFRLGTFCEYGGQLHDALACYDGCRSFPDAVRTATWNGVPLETVIEQRRVFVLESLTNNLMSRRSGTRSGNYFFSGFEHHKGSISKVFHVAYGEAHKPLKPTEAVRVMLRKIPADQEKEGEKIGRQLLAAKNLDCDVEIRTGMVVFSVYDRINGRPYGNEHRTKYLADILHQARQRMRKVYFDGGGTRPLLYVFANLYRGEELAQKMSIAVHSRGKNELEGYYVPLDNSIVLRKGLLVDNEWYLGTAMHELVHAEVKADLPFAPRWLDECLATLHEETSNGNPIDNYRLFYVQAAIDQNKLPSLSDFISSDISQWYGEEAPLLAAMARYFGIYLIENGNQRVLDSLYKELRAADFKNPPDHIQLVSRLMRKPIGKLDSDFRNFVRKRNPPLSKWRDLRSAISRYVHNLDDKDDKQENSDSGKAQRSK